MTLQQLLLLPLPGGGPVTVEQWYKKTGDVVTRGDPLLLLRTEQVVIDLPVPVSGTLRQLRYVPGDLLQAGVPLAEIELEQREASGRDHPPGSMLTATTPRMRATPLARKVAAVYGYDLGTITGSGYGGRIVQADILRLREELITELPTREPGSSGRAPAPIRKALPAPFDTDIPVAVTCMAVELAGAGVSRPAVQRTGRDVTLTPLTRVAYAVSQALLGHRLLHSAWSAAGVRLHGRITLVIEEHSTRRVIQDAAALSLRGIARAFARPAALDETGPAFTIRASSAWWAAASLAPGSAATLTMGSAVVQPVVVTTSGNDRVEQQRTALLTLCYDARILAQPEADAFLYAVKRRMTDLHGAIYATLSAQ